MNKPDPKKPPTKKDAIEKKSNGRQHPRLQTAVVGDSLTKQSFASDSNINTIMGRYMKTGELPTLNPAKPNYGYAPSYDFKEALEIVDKMSEQFEKLPAGIRQQFDNDPAEFLAFVEDPVNAPEARELGLLPPSDTPTPINQGSGAQEPQEAPPEEPPATTPPKSGE